MSTTNYFNTFIAVADDCPLAVAEIPPAKKGGRTVANIQFEMVAENPYQYTSDDVLFQVYAEKKGVAEKDLAAERAKFFSKGQPCFRSSPLTKRYGWGVHSDEQGRIAIYAIESAHYRRFAADRKLKQTRGMRSSRA